MFLWCTQGYRMDKLKLNSMIITDRTYRMHSMYSKRQNVAENMICSWQNVKNLAKACFYDIYKLT